MNEGALPALMTNCVGSGGLAGPVIGTSFDSAHEIGPVINHHWHESPLCPIGDPLRTPSCAGGSRRVAAPIGPKSEEKWSDCRLTGKAVNRAQAHPAATVPTTGHATTILHTLELPSWSPRGSGATQTSTSTSACCTRTERSTSDEAFSRLTSCFSMKQAASSWPVSRTT